MKLYYNKYKYRKTKSKGGTQMKKVKLAIFDMDGLMFDTERVALNSWMKAGQVCGYDITEEIILEFAGRNKIDIGLILKKYFGEDFPYEKVRNERFADSDKLMMEKGVPVKEGLFELLDYLEELGIKKVVATSTGRERAEWLLSRAGVLNRFDTIICGDEITKGKPEPEIFLKACEKMDVDPKDAVVLEDSEPGLLAASRAKIKCILVPDLLQHSEEIQKLACAKVKTLLEVRALEI
jgi:HAD superfamily hydrolase (TIGR01509 family)